MILKLLLTIIVIATVYFLFFKKSRVRSVRQKPAKKSSFDDENTMIECTECGTYTAVDEAYIKNGHYFCSKICMEKS
ncbi:MAG: hypothetical protein B5M52_00495 [Helicobacteraceae bacterium 4484_230]|nr:MAG: hypothetical protein B5M52_00495 [Helicobacteraceae bacterium 4484_230]